MEFKSKMSLSILVITVLGSTTLLSVCILLFLKGEESDYIYFKLGALLPIFFLTIAFLSSPRKLLISNSGLKIGFPIHAINIPFEDIIEVNATELIPSTNVGSKGIWGFIGWVNGDARSFVRDPKNVIYLKTKSKDYYLSCQDSKNCILEVKNRIL